MTESLTLKLSATKRTPGAPHIRNSLSVDGIILLYLFASVPCFVLGVWQTGRQWAGPDASIPEALASGLLLVIPRLVLLLGLGFGLARFYGFIRKERTDLGWLAVSWFFYLLVPASVDLLPAMLALSFGFVFVQFVFGGHGMAPFHATLGALIFLGVTFGDPGQSIQTTPDTVQGSSWYTLVGSAVSDGTNLSFLSLQTASLGVMSPALVLIAGIFLLVAGVASHRVMIAGVAGIVATSLLLDPPVGTQAVLSSWSGHLMLGNFLFVLVFLASDPAFQALTRPARWVAGFAFGTLTVLLRVLDPAHPESSLMALLLVSLCTPLVDAVVVRWAIWRRGRQHHA